MGDYGKSAIVEPKLGGIFAAQREVRISVKVRALSAYFGVLWRTSVCVYSSANRRGWIAFWLVKLNEKAEMPMKYIRLSHTQVFVDCKKARDARDNALQGVGVPKVAPKDIQAALTSKPAYYRICGTEQFRRYGKLKAFGCVELKNVEGFAKACNVDHKTLLAPNDGKSLPDWVMSLFAEHGDEALYQPEPPDDLNYIDTRDHQARLKANSPFLRSDQSQSTDLRHVLHAVELSMGIPGQSRDAPTASLLVELRIGEGRFAESDDGHLVVVYRLKSATLQMRTTNCRVVGPRLGDKKYIQGNASIIAEPDTRWRLEPHEVPTIGGLVISDREEFCALERTDGNEPSKVSLALVCDQGRDHFHFEISSRRNEATKSDRSRVRGDNNKDRLISIFLQSLASDQFGQTILASSSLTWSGQ